MELPSNDFCAELVSEFGGMAGSGARLRSSLLENGWEVAERVLSDSPLKCVDWGTLFAYMYRRFGPPHMGGDPYKDLSGGWLLTTPRRDLVVAVKPSVSGPKFCFRILSVDRGEAEIPRAADMSDSQRVEDVAAGFRAVLLDLLRPVGVRDAYINALGSVVDDDMLLDCEEHGERVSYEVEYAEVASRALPPSLIEGDQWFDLLRITRYLGDGDYSVGRDCLIDLAKGAVLSRLSKESPAVVALVGGRLLQQRMFGVADRLGLSGPTAELAQRYCAAFKKDSAEWPEVVEGLDHDEVEQADRWLYLLGGGGGFGGDIKELTWQARLDREYIAMFDAGDGEFPASCLPADGQYPGDVEALPERLRSAGADQQARWAERVLSESMGPSVVWAVLLQAVREGAPALSGQELVDHCSAESSL